MAAVKLTGQWFTAKRITRSMVGKFKLASDRAVAAEANFLRAKMVEGIRSQAPGGKAFLPLASSTIKARKFRGRGGTKALIQSGLLRNSIRVKRQGNATFVGILRTAAGGRANIAEMNEEGITIAARLTLKSLRFLHALQRRFRDRDERGRFIPKAERGGGKAKSPSGGGIGIMIIRIPARPFVRPIAEKFAQPRDVKRRFERNLAIGMGFQLGRV